MTRQSRYHLHRRRHHQCRRPSWEVRLWRETLPSHFDPLVPGQPVQAVDV